MWQVSACARSQVNQLGGKQLPVPENPSLFSRLSILVAIKVNGKKLWGNTKNHLLDYTTIS